MKLLALLAKLRGINADRSESVPEFEMVLADIVALKDTESIVPLLSFFRDDAEYDEVMFSIIHSIEVFDDQTYVRQILQGTVIFCGQSPRWASIVFMRILNSESTRSELVRQLRNADAGVKAAVKNLMQKINARGTQFIAKTTAIVVAAS